MKLSANAARRVIIRRMDEFTRNAPAEVERQMRESAADITGTMKRLVSDDPKLASSTDCGENPPAGPSGMMGGKGHAAKAGFRLFIWSGSDKAYWARWREYGTAPHSIARGASRKRGKRQNKGIMHPGTAPRPYFWPAWRAHQKPVKKAMRAAYRAVGKRVFGNVRG